MSRNRRMQRGPGGMREEGDDARRTGEDTWTTGLGRTRCGEMIYIS